MFNHSPPDLILSHPSSHPISSYLSYSPNSSKSVTRKYDLFFTPPNSLAKTLKFLL